VNYINKIIQGDCLEIIKQFPGKCIDSVITSPPYWQLRDYGWTGQWGLEKTYQEYLKHLWQLMDEICRVLKDDGTVWLNLGDTYTGSNHGHGGVLKGIQKTNTGTIALSELKPCTLPKNMKAKTLLLIPHRFAIGCIERGWIVRNDIIWAKRNGMPESCRDRFSKKHEYLFFMTKQEKYYFNLDDIRDAQKEVSLERYKSGYRINVCNDYDTKYNVPSGDMSHLSLKGKNPGSVSDFWDIPTMSSSEKHYATFNTKLIDKPIIAGCPIGGIILDPFCGTGTTLARAKELNRNYVGIEGSTDYIKIANDRLNSVQDNLL
jgi:DNA modification methylase